MLHEQHVLKMVESSRQVARKMGRFGGSGGVGLSQAQIIDLLYMACGMSTLILCCLLYRYVKRSRTKNS
jgi:hypothetical protein